MSSIVNDALGNDPAHQDDFFDDFQSLDVVGMWEDVSGDSGAAPSLAADGESAAVLTTGATDNNECYLVSNRAFDLRVGSQLIAECRLKATEANTDDLNILFGLMSAAGANSLLDNGGGPAANYSGAVFFKEDGATAWSIESSVATAQTTTATGKAAGLITYQTLRIQIDVITATEAEVSFHIGQEGGNHTRQVLDSVNHLPVKHTIDPTNFAAAKLILGAKAGGANSETPRIDFVRVSQTK